MASMDKSANSYEFRFFDLLLVPYCFLVQYILFIVMSGLSDPSDRLYKLSFIISFISAYPIFAKGRSAYWSLIGEWSFSKWLILALGGSLIFFLL